MSQLSEKPCPRCGCHIVKLFECNCGEVHSDYCGNCGRWTDLSEKEHLELSVPDVPCTYGFTDHIHHEAEKIERLRAHIERLKQQRDAQVR